MEKLESSRLRHLDEQELVKNFTNFLDTASTATARATFYNSKEEQSEALTRQHYKLMDVDKGIYGLSLLLPGITDYSKQMGIVNLLAFSKTVESFLTEDQELIVLNRLVKDLPVHRMLNAFLSLQEQRINNARTRKIILRTLLNSHKIELWSVKYRRKLKEALTHAWGKRKASIIRSILTKAIAEKVAIDDKEKAILQKSIFNFLGPKTKPDKVLESISFIFGNEENMTLPMLKAFAAAKIDFSKGSILPYEVLEGIRGRYHKDISQSKVLETTKSTLTKGQKINMQRKSKAENVEVKVNWENYDPARLYIFAYECGLNEEIQDALKLKAQNAAKKLPVKYGKIGIVVDNSGSMMGDSTQQRRPMAVALATKDLLEAASESTVIEYTNAKPRKGKLPAIEGDSPIAGCIIKLLKKGVEQIFILSDGYENSPAGRTNELVTLLHRKGLGVPIMQMNPVMAAEADGLRRLSESIQVMSISKPEALHIGLICASFERGLEHGLQSLLNATLVIGSGNKKT